MAALIVTAILGVGLYAAPDALGYDGPARATHLITGPVVAGLAVIALSDVARELRWVNFVLGAWLVLAGVLIAHAPVALAVGVTAGMAITALALVRGPINQQLGGGWRAVLRPSDSQSSDATGGGGNR
jgi:hypothetical protein